MSRNRIISRWSLAIVSVVAFVIGAFAPSAARIVTDGVFTTVAAQDPVTPPQEPDPAAGRGGRGQAAPRPYAQVVTSAFKTDDGVFKVHRGMLNNTDSVLFEIPVKELDKDFVWNVSLKKTTLGAGYGGQNVSSRIVRWTKSASSGTRR